MISRVLFTTQLDLFMSLTLLLMPNADNVAIPIGGEIYFSQPEAETPSHVTSDVLVVVIGEKSITLHVANKAPVIDPSEKEIIEALAATKGVVQAIVLEKAPGHAMFSLEKRLKKHTNNEERRVDFQVAFMQAEDLS